MATCGCDHQQRTKQIIYSIVRQKFLTNFFKENFKDVKLTDVNFYDTDEFKKFFVNHNNYNDNLSLINLVSSYMGIDEIPQNNWWQNSHIMFERKYTSNELIKSNGKINKPYILGLDFRLVNVHFNSDNHNIKFKYKIYNYTIIDYSGSVEKFNDNNLIKTITKTNNKKLCYVNCIPCRIITYCNNTLNIEIDGSCDIICKEYDIIDGTLYRWMFEWNSNCEFIVHNENKYTIVDGLIGKN